MIKLRLAREDLEGARALLQEMRDPDTEILEAIERGARALAERRGEIERLRGLERDLDGATQAGARRVPLIILAGFTIAMSALLQNQPHASLSTGRRLMAAAAGWAVIVATMALLQARLRQSAVNRGVALMLLVGSSAWVASRLLDIVLETAMPVALGRDLVMMSALGFLLSGVARQRWLLGSSTVFLIGAAVIAASPARSGEIFGATAFLAALLALLMSRRA